MFIYKLKDPIMTYKIFRFSLCGRHVLSHGSMKIKRQVKKVVKYKLLGFSRECSLSFKFKLNIEFWEYIFLVLYSPLK